MSWRGDPETGCGLVFSFFLIIIAILLGAFVLAPILRHFLGMAL